MVTSTSSNASVKLLCGPAAVIAQASLVMIYCLASSVVLAVSCGTSVVSGGDALEWDGSVSFGDNLIGPKPSDTKNADIPTPDLELLWPDLQCPDACPPDQPCIETPNGYQCAVLCNVGECPAGLACADYGDSPVCVSTNARLCLPCGADDDCLVPGLESLDSRCVLHSIEMGSYCTFKCKNSADCPGGYVCVDRDSGGSFCFPESGVCSCSPLAMLLQASTPCSRENPSGKCSGEVACSAEGLEQCSAKTPTAEACNGLDDNCNGFADEGLIDLDDNGIADCLEEPVVPDTDNDGAPDPEDCEPENPAVYPGADEACNALDDDCDTDVDEGFPDLNNDGWAECNDIDSDQDGYPDLDDCLPSDPTVYPGAQEVCNGKDDNCDSVTDPPNSPSCVWLFKDSDGDGFGKAGDSKCLCEASFPYTTASSTDCNDNDKNINPQAQEICNGKDDNCDGSIEPAGTTGCVKYYADADGDGFAGQSYECLCGGGQAPYLFIKADDCDDMNKNVNPGEDEICNSVDDNCDGAVDPTGTCLEPDHVVCIDPGDGGTEPGAVGLVTEKNLNLSMGLAARDWLDEDTADYGGGTSWDVVMTRTSDATVSLATRVEYANSADAERFVSIHNNACCGGTGTETYTAVASSSTSVSMATAAQTNLVSALGLTNRGTKKNDYYVLVHTSMPAIMIFPGFIDNSTDIGVINNSAGWDKVGKAVLKALQTSLGVGVYIP